jgi:hypothetical protein
MEFTTDQEVIDFIKEHKKAPKWVSDARTNHKTLNALITGKKFDEILLTQIEKIESAARSIARKKYSKDIRDMFDRVMQPRANVFTASGGSVHNDIKNKEQKEKFTKSLAHFKGQKSIKKYLSEDFFRLGDTDPNGLMFLEYNEDIDIWPTYKSINDIRYYESDGQLLDVLLFEPKTIQKDKLSIMIWRVVDEKKDWYVVQSGSTYTVNQDKTFEHPFGSIPATILSDRQETGSELRISSVFPIEELSKDYARDKSVLTIYKFQSGFPIQWRYIKECRTCQGTGKTGQEKCEVCTGTGELLRRDVTDIQTIEMPRDSDSAIITPNVAGFVSPDLETWKQYKDDLRDFEELIDSTMWGTKRIKESANETATGRFIDVQPVKNKLDVFSDNAEWTDNQLSKWVEDWVHGSPKEKSEYHKSYGRRFIIESPNELEEKYNKARENGANNTILDKLLDEWILSVYQNNPILLEEMQKKRLVEPYIHQSIDQVNEIFGAKQANLKVMFVTFWETADKSKTVEALAKEFAALDNPIVDKTESQPSNN